MVENNEWSKIIWVFQITSLFFSCTNVCVPAPRAQRRRVQDLFCITRKPYEDIAEHHNLGHMDVTCPDCGALHWLSEKLSSSSKRNPRFGTCCSKGRVHLPALEAPPEPLRTLFTSNDSNSKSFREDIWKYNQALAFTSLGVMEDHSINQGRGQPVFRICGELCHKSGALVPSSDNPPRYAQLYIYEPRAALESSFPFQFHLAINWSVLNRSALNSPCGARVSC